MILFDTPWTEKTLARGRVEDGNTKTYTICNEPGNARMRSSIANSGIQHSQTSGTSLSFSGNGLEAVITRRFHCGKREDGTTRVLHAFFPGPVEIQSPLGIVILFLAGSILALQLLLSPIDNYKIAK
jgi:hypothetical protein